MGNKCTIERIISSKDIFEANNNPQLAIIKSIDYMFKIYSAAKIEDLINIEYVVGLRSPYNNDAPIVSTSDIDGFKIICTFELIRDNK